MGRGELSSIGTCTVQLSLVCFLMLLYFMTFGEKKSFSKALLDLFNARDLDFGARKPSGVLEEVTELALAA